jgi:CRP-like cAMP-binding protein
MDLIQVLKRCEMFVGLSDDDLAIIAGLPSWRIEYFEKDSCIFKEGIVATDLYVLEDGEVNLFISRHVSGSTEKKLVHIDTVTKGDIFGWSSLVSPYSLTLTAICVKPSTIAAVQGAELLNLMDNNCSIGYEVMKGLVRVVGGRLRDLRMTLDGFPKRSKS